MVASNLAVVLLSSLVIMERRFSTSWVEKEDSEGAVEVDGSEVLVDLMDGGGLLEL